MPLEILAAMVVIGIATAALMVRFLVNAPQGKLENDTKAIQLLKIDYPAFDAKQTHISVDKRMAFLLPHGQKDEPDLGIGFVEAFGSKWVTRILYPKDIKSLTISDGRQLDIRLNDFTLSKVSVTFPDETSAQAVTKALKVER